MNSERRIEYQSPDHHLGAALRASNGRVAGPNGAAKRLGLAPSTLEFRIRRLGIERHRHRR